MMMLGAGLIMRLLGFRLASISRGRDVLQ